ncbi:MAG: hypothetical protein RIS43_166 [Actinomycetota bacterium]
MQNLLWILALLVIAATALAAMGGLGELHDEDELGTEKSSVIPTALFGYRKDVVDRLLDSKGDN